MSNKVIRRIPRLTAAVVGSSGGAAALLLWTSPAWSQAWSTIRQPSTAPHRLVGDAVVLVCTATLAALALWVTVSVLVCSVDALRGDGAPERAGVLRPRIVQALVAGLLGSVVVTSVAGAHGPREPQFPGALDGLSLPDRAYGDVHTHRVEVGESLWEITAGHLPERLPTAAVARRWPRLHHLNRDRIGADPHLIHPGTILRLPTWGSAPTRGVRR